MNETGCKRSAENYKNANRFSCVLTLSIYTPTNLFKISGQNAQFFSCHLTYIITYSEILTDNPQTN